jgi:hypothetical protein
MPLGDNDMQAGAAPPRRVLPSSQLSAIQSTMRGQIHMSSHEQRSNKEPKKQPLHSTKEKRAAKRAKKHAGDHHSLIVKKP